MWRGYFLFFLLPPSGLCRELSRFCQFQRLINECSPLPHTPHCLSRYPPSCPSISGTKLSNFTSILCHVLSLNSDVQKMTLNTISCFTVPVVRIYSISSNTKQMLTFSLNWWKLSCSWPYNQIEYCILTVKIMTLKVIKSVATDL